MVMLIWFILSLFNVCEFTWLPVFIDALLCTFLFAASSDNNNVSSVSATMSLGIATFAFYKYFFKLAISAWWILLSPAATLVMTFFPGGHTITNILFDKFNLMTLPTWGLVIGIILDVFYLGVLGYLLIDAIKSKKIIINKTVLKNNDVLRIIPVKTDNRKK